MKYWSYIMPELHFKSSLTEEEIEKNFENIDLFAGIIKGSKEALMYEQGMTKTETFTHKRSFSLFADIDQPISKP